MEILRTIVLVVGLVALLKGLWFLLLPDLARGFVDWWLRLPARVGRQLGLLSMILGVGFTGLAVARMHSATVAAVTIMGTLWVLGGLLYLSPDVLQTVGRSFGTHGPRWWARTAGGVAVAAGLVLLAIYLFEG